MKKIFRLTLDITNYCNFDCIYCTLEIPYHINVLKKNLSLNDIKIIVLYTNKFLPEYIIDVCIRGGEPFLNPNIDKIFKQLLKIEHLNNIYIFTNGSIPLDKFDINYKSIHEFRISIHVDTIIHAIQYKNIIFHNIKFLLSTESLPYIHIMKCVELNEFDVDDIYNQVLSIYKKYSINTDRIEITDTFSTRKYINNNYNYTQVNSMYNQGYKLPVYYNRAIKITPDMKYRYSCQLADNNITNNNVYIPSTWKIIEQNAKNKIICELEKCICPVFCFKE